MKLPTNILVPIDFSETADHALDYAIALAGKLGARIVAHLTTTNGDRTFPPACRDLERGRHDHRLRAGRRC